MANSSRFRVPIIAAILALFGLIVFQATRGRHDEFATLSGHREGVYSMAISPDGKLVASGGGDGAVRIWNLSNRLTVATMRGHKGRVQGLAWSPDSESIASCGADQSVRVWNATSGAELSVWKDLRRPVHEIAISDDGKTLAASVDADIYFWKLDSRRGPWVLKGHRRPISGLAFLPGTQELATFASDKTVRIWDLTGKRQVAEMPGPVGHCYGLKISSDGKLMATVGGGRVHLYDLEKRQALDPIEPGAGIICGMAFSSDGRTLAIGTQEKSIVIWDLLAKKMRTRLNGHDFAVAEMAFLADGKTLVTSSFDSTIKLWKVN